MQQAITLETKNQSNSYLRLNPLRIPIPATDNEVLNHFTKPWDPKIYKLPSKACHIGTVIDKEAFSVGSASLTLLRQVPIKFPGTEVCLPIEASQGKEAIQKIINHNFSASSAYHDNFAYLTFFSGCIPAGQNQRVSFTLHGDQMQSLDLRYRYNPDFAYFVSDVIPTVFYNQAFDLTKAERLHADGKKVDLYKEFLEQRDESMTYCSENYAINLISPYIVHRASELKHDQQRTFSKVIFSSRRLYDQRETYLNPAFDYKDWIEHLVYSPELLQFPDPNTKYLSDPY
jgi:hypothetical protein